MAVPAVHQRQHSLDVFLYRHIRLNGSRYIGWPGLALEQLDGGLMEHVKTSADQHDPSSVSRESLADHAADPGATTCHQRDLIPEEGANGGESPTTFRTWLIAERSCVKDRLPTTRVG